MTEPSEANTVANTAATAPPLAFEIHPAAELFPLMTGAEFDELVEDIQRARTVQVPIVLYRDPTSGERQLLDGRNRLRAVEVAGFKISVSPDGAVIASDGDRRFKVPHVETTADPYEIVTSLNAHRRHLTAEQKREIVAALLKAKPERSDRAIAKDSMVDHKTVAAVRAEGEAGGEIPHVETRIDSKGRQQPAKKPPVPDDERLPVGGKRRLTMMLKRYPEKTDAGIALLAAVPVGAVARHRPALTKPARTPAKKSAATAPTTSPAQERDKAIDAFAAILHARLADTLDDLTRLLRNERPRITSMAVQKRVGHVRAYMQIYGVVIDDLRPVE